MGSLPKGSCNLAPWYLQLVGQRFNAIEAHSGGEVIQVPRFMKNPGKLVLGALFLAALQAQLVGEPFGATLAYGLGEVVSVVGAGGSARLFVGIIQAHIRRKLFGIPKA